MHLGHRDLAKGFSRRDVAAARLDYAVLGFRALSTQFSA
jgi:hypothetical protein